MSPYFIFIYLSEYILNENIILILIINIVYFFESIVLLYIGITIAKEGNAADVTVIIYF